MRKIGIMVLSLSLCLSLLACGKDIQSGTVEKGGFSFPTKAFDELEEENMIDIARSLLRKKEEELWDNGYNNRGINELKTLKQKLYFDDAESITDITTYYRDFSEHLNNYADFEQTFSDESVEKKEHEFIYHGDMLVTGQLLSTDEAAESLDRYTLTIAFDEKSETYKIKSETWEDIYSK